LARRQDLAPESRKKNHLYKKGSEIFNYIEVLFIICAAPEDAKGDIMPIGEAANPIFGI
jgi:hypothetical protein